MNGFLIPANSKKSLYIFGLFTTNELIMFSSGVGLTLILLIALPLNNIWASILALMPGLITGLLVLPVPHYHNVMTFLKEMYLFYTERQKFVWKGWCFLDGSDKE